MTDPLLKDPLIFDKKSDLESSFHLKKVISDWVEHRSHSERELVSTSPMRSRWK